MHRNVTRIYRSISTVGEHHISIFLRWYVCISWIYVNWCILTANEVWWVIAIHYDWPQMSEQKKIHLWGAPTIRLYVWGWRILMHSMNQLCICGKNTAVYSRFHRALKTHSLNWHLASNHLVHHSHALELSSWQMRWRGRRSCRAMVAKECCIGK